MKYNQLETVATKSRKRVGRGIASGHGKTAGRGTKGQRARTGKKLGATFAGGQLPIVQGIPKLRGFKSKRAPAQTIYADQLNEFAKKSVDNFVLFEAGLISTPFHAVKVIAREKTTFAGELRVAGASASVLAEIKKNGGKFEKTAVPLPKSEKVEK